MTDRYDVGLLGDGGGGNVDWWHDYIRAELERSHDHYAAQLDQAAHQVEVYRKAMADAEERARLESASRVALSEMHRQRLADIRSKLEKIVATDPVDSGVILLSDHSPTHKETRFFEGVEQVMHVYDHEHLSPLGDALIEVWELTKESTVEPEERMLKWFEYGHLPEKLQAVSKPFGDLALSLVDTVASGPERTVALRKLLEAKDAAVRAALNPGA